MKKIVCFLLSVVLVFSITVNFNIYAEEIATAESAEVEIKNPEQEVETVEGETETPEQEVESVESETEIPEQEVESVEGENVTPELETENPEEEVENPETEVKMPEVFNVSTDKAYGVVAEADYNQVDGKITAYKFSIFSKTATYGYLKIDITEAFKSFQDIEYKNIPEIKFLTDIIDISFSSDNVWRLSNIAKKESVYLEIKREDTIEKDILKKIAGAKFKVGFNIINQKGVTVAENIVPKIELVYTAQKKGTGVQAYSITGSTVSTKSSTKTEKGLIYSAKNGESVLISEGTVIMITGRTIDLQGSISMIFYADFAGIDLKSIRMLFWDSPQNDYTEATAEKIVKHSGKDSNGYRFEYTNISSKDMSKKVYARLMAKDNSGNTVYSSIPNIGYSVVSYTKNMMKNEKLKPLLIKMLNYGAAAQEYFGSEYRPANAHLAETERVLDLTRLYVSEAQTIEEPTNMGKCQSKIVGKTLVLEGDISINYYVSSNEKVNEVGVLFWSETAFKNAKSHVMGTQSSIDNTFSVKDGYKIFSYENIVSRKIFEPIYARVYTRTGNVYRYGDIEKYSVKDYAAHQIEKNSDPALTKLLRCLLLYADEAEKYFRLINN